MADVLVGSERRVLISGYGGLPAPPVPPPPPESLLDRLDQIDLRLRQLEEQRGPAPAAADDDDSAVARRAAPHKVRHHHTKSLPSALQHVQVRGNLMDRLNLLESRIRQLSCELDLDVGGGKARSGSYAAAAAQLGMMGGFSSVVAAAPAVEDPAWSDTAPMLEPCRDPAAAAVMMSAPAASKSAAAVAATADGNWSAVEILQRGARQLHRNKSSAPNKVKNLKEAKCACQKEKRKAERVRTGGRRWFTVGC